VPGLATRSVGRGHQPGICRQFGGRAEAGDVVDLGVDQPGEKLADSGDALQPRDIGIALRERLLGMKRWSLPGSWFSPGSVARPMMGVRGVTPRGGKRSDRAYAHSIHGLCAVVLTRRPGKDSASAGAELVWRIVR